MYKNIVYDDENIGLHDCRINQMSYENGVLSFCFYDGIFVIGEGVDEPVRTGRARMDCHIIDEEIDGVSIYVFDKKTNGRSIRIDWTDNFIAAINDGSFEYEFVTTYKSYQHILFKGYVWFDKKPYCKECEIELHTDKVTFMWDDSIEHIVTDERMINRICQMEKYFDDVLLALKYNPKSINTDDELQKMILDLKNYSANGQWLEDYEADERGELPKELKRGVLSQDGLHNLLCELHEKLND